MMFEIFILVVMALLGAIMLKRITENPFRIRYNVVEGGANTFTEVAINLPVAAGVGPGANKVQAIELMGIKNALNFADPEAGQNNSVAAQLTRDSKSSLLQFDDDDLIWARVTRTRDVEVTAVGEIVIHGEEILPFEDLTDGDGNGEVIMERTINMSVQGSGNAAAKRNHGYLLAHLVELDADEVAVQIFVDDA